jgi:hypothetical protein
VTDPKRWSALNESERAVLRAAVQMHECKFEASGATELQLRWAALAITDTDPPEKPWNPLDTPRDVCWHCQCCLEPPPYHCCDCPSHGECDDPDCEEPGCKGIAPVSAEPKPIAMPEGWTVSETPGLELMFHYHSEPGTGRIGVDRSVSTLGFPIWALAITLRKAGWKVEEP